MPIDQGSARTYFAASDGASGTELWVTDGTAAGTALLKDVNPGSGSSNPNAFTQLGDKLIFAATDAANGVELWVSDGTSAGTVLLKNINAGGASSNPNAFTRLGDKLLFTATDGTNGAELWITDGTAAGTVLLKNISAGAGNSTPTAYRQFGDKVVFSATDPFNGTQLWVTDGTGAGTVSLKSLPNGSRVTDPTSFKQLGDKLLFTAADVAHGVDLWVTDGTEAGTTALDDVVAAAGVYNANSHVQIGGRLVFAGTTYNNGYELWVTDGTSAGTTLLRSEATPAGFTPYALTQLGGRVVFTATTAANGTELWITDGTSAGTVLLKDIAAGSGSSTPGGFRLLGDRLVFAATDGNGTELWVTDGTSAGTVLLKDIYGGAGSSNPSSFTQVGNLLIFSATDPANGTELWVTDGTAAGTTMLSLNGRVSSSLVGAGVIGGRFIFAQETAANGTELWATDGTSAGTVLLKDIYAGATGSDPHAFTRLGDKFVFAATSAANGVELWATDGTVAGTVLLKDIYAGANGSAAGGFTLLGDKLIFSAESNGSGTELWVTDGTTAGTVLLKDINPGAASSTPGTFTKLGDKLIFSAYQASSGFELWVTDGTAGGTVLLKDINTGTASSFPSFLTPVGDKLIFVATAAGSGKELWVTDGTAAGTVLLKDINPGSASSSPSGLVRLGDKVVFAAGDGASGKELWVSDGTAAGTTLLKDIYAGAGSSNPAAFAQLGGKLVFSATDTANGAELWVTDGTAAGTVLLKDIRAGTGSAAPGSFALVGDKLVFAANDGSHGTELWITDGTAGGTVLLKDVNLGAVGSNPRSLVATGDGKAAFIADDADGFSYSWITDGTDAGTVRLIKLSAAASSNPGGFTTVTSGAPDARNDAFSASAGATLANRNLLADNGSGADTGSGVSVTAVNGTALVSGGVIALASGARLLVNADGTFSYDPHGGFDALGAGQSATETFTYTLSSGSRSDTATATITVQGVNDAPAGSPSATLAHGTQGQPYTVTAAQLLAGFTDIDGDALSVVNLTAGGGAVVADNGGSFTITMPAGFSGPLTLGYTVSDGHGGTLGAQQGVTFDRTNQAPAGAAGAQLAHGTEDQAYTVTAAELLAGFSDADGDALAVTNLAADRGNLVNNSDGTYTITLPADANGTVGLSYTVSDGRGGTLGATQSFTVDAVNDAPVLTGQQAVLAHGTEDQTTLVAAAQLLSGFTDADGDTLAVTGLTSNRGTVADNGDGTYAITLPADANGTVCLSYTVSDGHGGTLGATRNVVVDAVNDAPAMAAARTAGTSEDTATGALAINAADVDGDVLGYALKSGFGPARGAVSFDQANGTFTFTPAPDANGTDAFTILVSDGHGGLAEQVVTVDVAPVNDAPTLTGPKPVLSAGTQDQAYQVTAAQLLAGFTDAENDALSIVGLSSDRGSVTDNGNGTYTLVPQSGYSGQVNLSYGVSDGHGATTSASQGFALAGANIINGTSGRDTLKAPSAAGWTLNGLAGADTLTGGDGADTLNGGDDADTLDGKGGADALNGGTGNDSYYVDNAGDAVVEDANAGTEWVYASVDYTLSANLEYLSLMGGALKGTGNALSNIVLGNALNNTLTGGAGLDRLDGGAGVDTLIGGADSDTYVIDNVGDVVVEKANEGTDGVTSSVDYVLADNVEQLTLTGNAAKGWANAGGATLIGNDLANVLTGAAGRDTLNGGGGNDTLVGAANNDALNGGAGTDTAAFLRNFADYAIQANSSGFTVTGEGVDQLTGIELAAFADGSYDFATRTFTPSAPANRAPALAGAQSVLPHAQEDTGFTVTAAQLLAGFTDADGDPLSIANLTASNAGVTNNGDGTYTIAPVANYNGAVGLTYAVTDGRGGSASATLGVVVDAVNDAPTGGVSINGSARQDQTLTAAHTLADVDGLGTVSFQWLRDGAAIGGATGTSYVLGQADVGHQLSVRAGYVDGAGTSESATSAASAAVTGVNHAPALTGQQATLAHGTEDAAYVLTAAQLLAGFTDPDGDALAVTGLTASAGSVLANNDGTFTLTPASNANGGLALSYAVSDGHGGTLSASQSLVLDAVNDAPTLTGPKPVLSAGTQDQAYQVTAAQLLAGFTDAENDALSIVGLSSDRGSVTDNGNGTYTLVPQSGYSGQVNLSYGVSDGQISTAASQGFTLNTATTLTGTGGADTLAASSAAGWTLNGLAGNDTLTGAGGADTLNGGDNNDTLDGKGGNDFLFGGAGDDTLTSANNEGNDLLDGGAGTDVAQLMRYSAAAVFALGDPAGDTLFQGTTLRNIERVNFYGSAFNDSVTGGGFVDQLYGNAANDTLDGRGGNDFLNGGAGNDTLEGGLGLDQLMGGANDDTFVLRAGQGSGDIVLDFTGAGAAGGDLLKLIGYGSGARIAQAGTSDTYTVSSQDGSISETVKLAGVTNLDLGGAAGDFLFV